MTMQRWIFVIVAGLLALVTIAFVYFREIQNPLQSEVEKAKAQAVEAAELTEVEQVYHHVWDTSSWIVKGKGKDNEQLYVWLVEGAVPEVVKASAGITQQELNASFKSEHPDAHIKRIQPGLLDSQRVWEIFYSIGEQSSPYKYDFYDFASGQLINSYTLPSRTEP
ncbi:DUF5590 domain-containing protein [Paenibacillus sinopodophylli]|uniref:cell wall elongation regulator TseB-like domain-containing protein n=1 Tax=Paenibacillus sinopodophylli TaxID=1837342 RepID=UPI00110CD13E|nr:DUF5590 domain-containing protein [Paenibacillus sinopodophylli]